ncbi:heterokaryon incompatibility protein-domain-containing protein [Parachaetomium inaequale]|uniref:Heterokaryon incompatibility protein-domain-containing protein n=1 Tax=Parachaetomium inaequale TaxID=2588326 RepID=A0AAN6PCN1_9PEZI|nr:heterokaryon incompatibility protein-domain-containing protein [Parachaetomium inaequale]
MERLTIGEGGLESKEPYQYQPLPTLTSIRVLKVIGKEEDGTVHVSLKTVDLDDNPAFYALSYTWGNPHANGVDFTAHFNAVSEEYSTHQKRPILCDGERLGVQRNLFDVLHEFLEAFAGEQERNQNSDSFTHTPLSLPDGNLDIWIDAVCINQDDMEERGHQVRIMDKVYSKAAHTIVWLGRADEYTPAAVETIRRVAAYPRDVFVQSEASPFRRQDPEIYAKSNLEYTGWMDWCSLAALLKRQWFSRLWIIQEAILSRDLALLCGKHGFSWADLIAAARNIEARCEALGWSPSVIFIQSNEVAVPLEHNLLRLADWRDHFHNRTTTKAWHFTLENLVYDTWVFTSGDPRDKIYGILGLASPQVCAAWDINYRSTAEEVYAIATRTIVEHSKSLKILSCVQDASVRKIDCYPSWAPDYSLPWFNMMCNHGSFAAAGAQYPTPQLLPTSPGPVSWSRLRLRAHVFDTIVETGADRTDYVNSSMILDPSWFELALLLETPYPATGQRRTEVLWRTLCADQDASSSTSPAPARLGALFKELISAMVVVRADLEAEESGFPDPAPDCATSFAQALRRAKEMWADALWDHLTPQQIREKTQSRPRFFGRPEFGWLVYTLIKMQALALTEEGGEAYTPGWDELERFHETPSYVMRKVEGEDRSFVQQKDPAFVHSFRRRYGKRKLFYTEKGYLGLGPCSVAVGDVVCVLPGASGPFVFREDREGGVKLEDDQNGSPENSDDGSGDDRSTVKRLRLIGESYVHGIMNGEAVGLEGFGLEEIEIV